jgi:hypothetical protein
MNQSQPDPDDDVPGAEPEEDDPPLAAPGEVAAAGEPETDGRKYRPL